MFEAATGQAAVIGTAAIDSSHMKARRSAESASLGGWRKRGAFEQAIGRSRGGRTTTLHALSDDAGRPRVLLLAPGNQHGVTMAPGLLRRAGPIRRLLADKAYDTNKLRQLLPEQRVDVVIPSIVRRKPLIPHDAVLYRQRNLIERMFGSAEGLPTHRHPIRQARQKFPRQHHASRYAHLVELIAPRP